MNAARQVKMRNTADHWFVPGDQGQTVTYQDGSFTVISVTAESEAYILTYGLRLIPAEVMLVLEPEDGGVVQ